MGAESSKLIFKIIFKNYKFIILRTLLYLTGNNWGVFFYAF